MEWKDVVGFWQQDRYWIVGIVGALFVGHWVQKAADYIKDWMEDVRDSLKELNERAEYLWPLEALKERKRDAEMASLWPPKQPPDQSKRSSAGQ